MQRALLFGALCGALSACGEPAPDVGGPELATATRVVFEVDAQPGAQPRGALPSAVSDPWELTRLNAEALIPDRTIELPTEDESGTLEVEGEDFDAQTLLDIAAAHADLDPAPDTAVFHFLFLDGYYAENGERQDSVLGVSLGDTGVIAMFTPVIGDGVLARFVEQTTMIHELGHAVGLVDNGLTMVDDHLDREHGAHCTVDTCVMYWLNEGVSDLRQYVQQYVATGETVIFDDACLADARAGLQ